MNPYQRAYDNMAKKRQQRSENFFRLMVIVGCLVILFIYWSYQDKKNEVLYKNTVEQRLASNAANGNYGPGFGGAR